MINVTNPHVAEDHDVMIERLKIEESLAAQMDKPLVLKELFKVSPAPDALKQHVAALCMGCMVLLGLHCCVDDL